MKEQHFCFLLCVVRIYLSITHYRLEWDNESVLSVFNLCISVCLPSDLERPQVSVKRIELKKGQIQQRKGDLNSKVYHVHSGLLRSYSIDEKGKEHIYMFAPEGWIIGDGVPPNEPCKLFIEALEDSVVFQVEKNDHDISETDKLIKRLEVLQERIILLMSATAIERYDHFVATYPNIVQRVPQRMIASYLGITPEALSAAKRARIKR